MKRLHLLFGLVFILTACQKDELALEDFTTDPGLEEKATEIATTEGVSLEAFTVATKETSGRICVAQSLLEVVAKFKADNQDIANTDCETVIGYVTGCLEGYMTYATILVLPDPEICPPKQ